MGLLDKRTLRKAKNLAMKNKAKIASGVDKATDVIDKKTKGKHSDKLKKVDDAAAKFAGTGHTHIDSPDDGAAAADPAPAPAESEPRDTE